MPIPYMIVLQTESHNMSGNSDGQDLTVHSFHEVCFQKLFELTIQGVAQKFKRVFS